MINIETLCFSQPDLDGALTLYRRADEFRPKAGHVTDANSALHLSAVAFELAFKSSLVAAGARPWFLRYVLGHNLRSAARWSRLVGVNLPSFIESILDYLHPHFMVGGFQRQPSRTWPAYLVGDTICALESLMQELDRYLRSRRPAVDTYAYHKAFQKLDAFEQAILLRMYAGRFDPDPEIDQAKALTKLVAYADEVG